MSFIFASSHLPEVEHPQNENEEENMQPVRWSGSVRAFSHLPQRASVSDTRSDSDENRADSAPPAPERAVAAPTGPISQGGAHAIGRSRFFESRAPSEVFIAQQKALLNGGSSSQPATRLLAAKIAATRPDTQRQRDDQSQSSPPPRATQEAPRYGQISVPAAQDHKAGAQGVSIPAAAPQQQSTEASTGNPEAASGLQGWRRRTAVNNDWEQRRAAVLQATGEERQRLKDEFHFDQLDKDGDGRVYAHEMEGLSDSAKKRFNILNSTDPDRVILPIGATGYEQVYGGKLLEQAMQGRPAEDVHKTAYEIMRSGLGGFGTMAVWSSPTAAVRAPAPVPMRDFIDPKNVRFTQNSVSANFKNGQSINDTAAALKGPNGPQITTQMPPIKVVQHEGQLFSLDNRRLSTFALARQQIPYRPATPAEIKAEWARKFTTNKQQGWGEIISVRPPKS